MDYRPQYERLKKKLLEYNIREYLHHTGIGKSFLNKTQESLTIEKESDKLDYNKIKNFYYQRQHQENEKASYSGRRCVQGLCPTKDSYLEYRKNSYKSTTKKANNPTKACKILEQTLYQIYPNSQAL